MHGKYIFDNLDQLISWLLGKITLSLGGNGCCLHKKNEEVNRISARWQIELTPSQLTTSQRWVSFKLLLYYC